MKKIWKWLLAVVMTPLVLFVALAVLLYLPPVQNWAVKQVAAYASEKTGMDISVGHVSLVFPLDLCIDHFRMIQPNDSLPQVKDTIADVQRLVVSVQLMPLFSQQVEIDALDFSGLHLNTANFVHEARVKAVVQRLYLTSHGINWAKETVRVDDALLQDAQVSVELSDTVPPDTSKSENKWRITVDRLRVKSTAVTLHMPGDTLQIAATLGDASVANGYFDLGKSLYQVKKFDWTKGSLAYDNRFKVKTKGLDVNHIALSDINVGIDSLDYSAPRLRMSLRQCSFKEKSGLTIDKITAKVDMDSLSIALPGLWISTPESHLRADVAMDFNAFDDRHPGQISVVADGAFGKQDIMRFLGGMPSAFVKSWPNQPLTVKAVAKGNMKHLRLAGLNVKLPTAFNANLRGTASHLADLDRMQANLRLEANTQRLDFVTALLSQQGGAGVTVPQGIGLRADLRIDGQRYATNFKLTQGGGSIAGNARVNMRNMNYAARLMARQFRVGHFMPSSGMGSLTADLRAEGQGTDMMSPRTDLSARADIGQFTFGKYQLDGMDFNATLHGGKAEVSLKSDNPLLRGTFSVSALMRKLKRGGSIHSTLMAELEHADWQGLRLVDYPLSTSLCCHVDVDTDLSSYVNIEGLLADLVIVDSGRVFRPDDMVVDVLSSRDTTYASMTCGDFMLRVNAQGSYRRVLAQCENVQEEIMKQWREKRIDIAALRTRMPLAEVFLTTGKENPFSRFVSHAGFAYNDAYVNLVSSPTTGLIGNVEVVELQRPNMLLDTLRIDIMSDSTQCNYHVQVRNAKNNPQYTFNALLDGYLLERGSGMKVRFYDEKNRLGLKLGAEAYMEQDGIKMHLLTDDPILGYRQFTVNDDNYLYLGSNKRVSANLKLFSADGMGVQIYTHDENEEALQDLTVGLHQFDLEKILSVIPYMPKITGVMNGDFHLIQTAEELSVSSSLAVDNMTYEGSRMGNIGTEFVYMPQSDGTHTIDGILLCNDAQVADIRGSYQSEGDGDIDATISMDHTPLRLLNGFFPDRIIRLRGYADGTIGVKGSLKQIDANGELALDSCYLKSSQYGVNLRLCEGPIRIVGSHLLLEDFKMYATNDSPLTVQGDIDFSNVDDMRMNMQMQGKNIKVIDSKERRRSVVYGKAFVDCMASIQGPVNNLMMRGQLDVLGTTDISYILRDSPLTTDNQLEELIKFTSFTDTTTTTVTHQPLSGFNMDMTMNIDQGAHVMCYLNADHSNYVDLIGGGRLRMTYNAQGELRLTGKYTLDNGEMKYSLPVIPLKTFTIQDGSYIEFTGDPMNPKLNIMATERTKANVGASGQERSVDFDCGVNITQTLSNMGLEFTLDAPEDMTLHNELQAMGTEQRGKLAVTMLTTGMYLADGNTSGFSMNSALSSFLQSEINNITGNALRTLDLSFGMDNATDASGNTHTDYSFKFSKRFWNNRLKIVVGGKVSTGAEVTNQNESFFDNVTFEYRLGNSADKYVKLYYDNNAYDWLEGNTREYGVGLIWRRSLQHFNDIFKLKSDNAE